MSCPAKPEAVLGGEALQAEARSMVGPMSPVAGWYPDPAGGPNTQRYWDGSQWTVETRVAQAPPPPPPPPPPQPEMAVPPPPPPTPLIDSATDPAIDPAIEPAIDPVTDPAIDPSLGAVAEHVVGATDNLADSTIGSAGQAVDPAVANPLDQVTDQVPAGLGQLGASRFEENAMAGTVSSDAVDLPPAPETGPPAGGPPPPTGPSGPTPVPVAGVNSVAGISTELLDDGRFAEVQSQNRVARQNSRMLRILLGDDVLAKQGSMVAFQGNIDFDHEGSGASKFLKKALTGEGVALMRCSGQGELFLADAGNQVHIIHLSGAGLTVNGNNILAFEPSLNWDIERVKGAGMAAGGLFNTRLDGHGWVAITTDGDPVVLRTNQPTFADTDAAVAWSSSLQTSLNRTIKAGALIGRGSGEAVQLTFQGDGIVIVQPSEGGVVPPHSH